MIGVTGSTQLLGIIGHPIGHTASPVMHQAALDQLGLDFIYVAFDARPTDLPHLISAIRCPNFRGVNVTIPYKEAVIPYLDKLDGSAADIGAVNTIVCEGDALVGYNTDGDGFILSLSLEYGISVAGKRVLVLGAGGAAKSICFALLNHGIQSLIIGNRHFDRAHSLALDLSGRFSQEIDVFDLNNSRIYDQISNIDLIINTTPVGMYGADLDADDFFSPLLKHIDMRHIVSDIIYRPMKTAFLAEAEARGATICLGYGMLVGQGVRAFELFTGMQPDYQLMKRKVIEYVNTI